MWICFLILSDDLYLERFIFLIIDLLSAGSLHRWLLVSVISCVSQEPRTSSGSPMRVVGTRAFGPFSTAFLATLAGHCTASGAARTPTGSSRGVADVLRGASTHCAITLTPTFSSLQIMNPKMSCYYFLLHIYLLTFQWHLKTKYWFYIVFTNFSALCFLEWFTFLSDIVSLLSEVLSSSHITCNAGFLVVNSVSFSVYEKVHVSFWFLEIYFYIYWMWNSRVLLCIFQYFQYFISWLLICSLYRRAYCHFDFDELF